MKQVTRKRLPAVLPRAGSSLPRKLDTTERSPEPDLLLRAIDGHVALCVTSPEGVILHVNKRMALSVGYRPAELRGREFGLLLGNGNDFLAMRKILSTGEVWRGELKQITREGRNFWVDTTVVPLPAERGWPASRLFIQTEITNFKQAEIALQDSEARHRALLEQASEPILLVDMDGWLVAANRCAEEITGYSRHELLQLHMQQLVPANFRPQLMTLHRSVLEKGRSVFHGGFLLRKDGQQRPLDLSCAIIESEGRRVIQAILHDVSRRKRMEAELMRARVAAERANRIKTELMSRISHELRTPLNAILGFAQLLESDREPPLAASHREGVNQILHAGWHLLELIEDILNFSRIEMGALRVDTTPVVLSEVLQECCDLLAPLAKERRVVLEIMPVAAALRVLADRVRLKEVLLNLGSNAIKYNKINGCVSYSVVVEGGGVRINVSDTGIGIRPEQMRRLFEPFERLGQEESAIQGSGLGLVIAKRLTELMGGVLGVWSEFGVGSTFWVDLPRWEGSP